MKWLYLFSILLVLVSCSVSTSSRPKVFVDPNTYDFGSVNIVNCPLQKNIEIRNAGTETIKITALNLKGASATDFSIITPVPFEVVKKSSMMFTISFCPVTEGSKNAEIEIVCDVLQDPLKVEISGNCYCEPFFFEDFEVVSGWYMSSGAYSTGQASWYYINGGNTTGGSGRYIGADSDRFSGDVFDEYIESPVIDCSSYTTGKIYLEFDADYQDYDPDPYGDYGQVGVYDGTNWKLVDEYYYDFNSTGEHRKYDVSNYALGNANFGIVFYYFGCDCQWFCIDNVKVKHMP